MIKSDLKFAIRSITRNKVQSAISILGLGIGLGCMILLLALILHETSFNRFIPDHRNVYRIKFGNSGLSHYPLAEKMKEEFPEVKDFFRFFQTNNIELRNMNHEMVRDNLSFSDPSLFKILGIRFISGNQAGSVTEVAISEKTALKYFGNLSPLGEILQIKLTEGFVDLSVSGVYKNFPAASTFYPEMIADIKLSERMFIQYQKSLGNFGNETYNSIGWNNPDFLSFVVLDPRTDPAALAKKMEKYKELLNEEQAKEKSYSLQPVADMYLRSKGFSGGWLWRQGNPNELLYYELISLLILIIAVTNYILLKRASTSDRLREMGTRKVFGASPGTLRKQIILESNLVALSSLIPAVFVVDSGTAFINDTLDKTLNNEIFSNPMIWILIVSVVLLTGTVSGYLIGLNFPGKPAFLLLSGKVSHTVRSERWNYSFLVLHFSIYIILVSGVITITKQIKFSLTNFKGIDPENVLISSLDSRELKSSFTAICEEMKKIPGVLNVSGSSFIPPIGAFLPVALQAGVGGEKAKFDGLIMGEGMTELLEIEVIDGSPFGPYREGSVEVLFNESSALKYKMKPGDNFYGVSVKGIVKDFHAHSLHRLIQPMVILQQNPSKMALLAIKTDGANDKAIIKKLRELYYQIAPNQIFEPGYLTDQVSDFYSYDKNQGKIIGAFSLLATLLSIMGLFGIALLSISKRTKEIGIRKVNGATIAEVLYLLNKGFVSWVLVSIVISVPVSVYFISLWMERFAYKTEISWWIFELAGISALIIALLTVSWHSWRAATRNPVEALRYE